MRGNEVHPYHLMRYSQVVFAQPALEKLQDSLRKSSSRRAARSRSGEGREEAGARAAQNAESESGGGGVMKSAYQIIRPSGDHGKGPRH